MRKKIDYYENPTTEFTDQEKNIAEHVGLLIYALSWNEKEINAVLERCEKEGLILAAYYPAFDDKEPEGEAIGGIMDGGLYLVKA